MIITTAVTTTSLNNLDCYSFKIFLRFLLAQVLRIVFHVPFHISQCHLHTEPKYKAKRMTTASLYI